MKATVAPLPAAFMKYSMAFNEQNRPYGTMMHCRALCKMAAPPKLTYEPPSKGRYRRRR
jgi:hypothetical protein